LVAVIFLGANIDAVETAWHYGIDAQNAQNYHADGVGLSFVWFGIPSAVSAFRRTGTTGQAWKNTIANDFDDREKN
jgi:hypothetical protein